MGCDTFGDPLCVANVADLFCKSGQFGPPGASRGPPAERGVQNPAVSGIRSASQTWRISFAKVANSGPQGPPVGPPPSGGSRVRQFRGSAPRRKRSGFLLQKWPVRAPRGLPWAPAQPGGRECDRVGYARGRSGGNRREALGDPEPVGASGGAAPLRIILEEGWPGRLWGATPTGFLLVL